MVILVSVVCTMCRFTPVSACLGRLLPTDISHQIICYGSVSRSDQFLTKRCHRVSQVYTLFLGLENSQCLGPPKVHKSLNIIVTTLGLQTVEHWQWKLYRSLTVIKAGSHLNDSSHVLFVYLRLWQCAVWSFIICSPSPGPTTREAFKLQEDSSPWYVQPHTISRCQACLRRAMYRIGMFRRIYVSLKWHWHLSARSLNRLTGTLTCIKPPLKLSSVLIILSANLQEGRFSLYSLDL